MGISWHPGLFGGGLGFIAEIQGSFVEFEGSCKEVKRKIIRGRQLIYHALLQWIAGFSGNIGLFGRGLGALVEI